jgi:hypothetical protein
VGDSCARYGGSENENSGVVVGGSRSTVASVVGGRKPLRDLNNSLKSFVRGKLEPIRASIGNAYLSANGIVSRRLADNLMPGGYGKVAGDRAPAMAILDDLHEVAALAGREAIRFPIVESR